MTEHTHWSAAVVLKFECASESILLKHTSHGPNLDFECTSSRVGFENLQYGSYTLRITSIDQSSISHGLSEVSSQIPTLVIVNSWVEKDSKASSGLSKEKCHDC